MMPDYVVAMIKHLPPSASNLRLLDIGGVVGATLLKLRDDLTIEIASLYVPDWSFPPASVDAVLGYDVLLSEALLSATLEVMRPGGRLIVVNPLNDVDEAYVTTLEAAGYVRILVEPALRPPSGVLIRGEKVHTTADTTARVEQVAARDADWLNLDDYQGRYVHLLVQQTPNKPVWKLAPDERIIWQAIGIDYQGATTLLAFSSLPKAVNFMQPAVLEGFVHDINKVGKFSKEVARTWSQPVLLNPTLTSVRSYEIRMVSVDPQTAEAPDE